jgi:CheY-like chemotaxis protein
MTDERLAELEKLCEGVHVPTKTFREQLTEKTDGLSEALAEIRRLREELLIAKEDLLISDERFSILDDALETLRRTRQSLRIAQDRVIELTTSKPDEADPSAEFYPLAPSPSKDGF